jgi:hypothetical protein
VNGFAIDTSKLNRDFRIVRFVRDPRDLVVSGYYYHKRGAEPWFRFPAPSDRYWQPINARVPKGMTGDMSYSEYLNSLSLEQGLLAEIEFRRYQFESLRQWTDDARIKLFKYEHILGNEARVFAEIADFYELPYLEKKALGYLADRYAAHRRRGSGHIRNPEPGQWRDVFPDTVSRFFSERYSDILHDLNYQDSSRRSR